MELTILLEKLRMDHLDAQLDAVCEQAAAGEMDYKGVLATAILDRLLHHATTLYIKGESYRLKEKRRAGLLGQVKPVYVIGCLSGSRPMIATLTSRHH